MAEAVQDQSCGVADLIPTPSSPWTSGFATLVAGENANLRFINSPVNVAAGDQILANKVVYEVRSTEGEAHLAKHDASYEELIKICNDHTEKVTAINVLDDFEYEELQQPDFEVYPQMRQVDVKDYYKGRYGNDYISIGGSQGRNRNQLTKEVGFNRQDTIKAKLIEIGDIIESIWQRPNGTSGAVGVTAIVASAGSGKSTLTRRIARLALSTSSAKDKVQDASCRRPKMVLYIELKDIEGENSIKPSKFVFGGMYENVSEEDKAFKWLVEHQSEAILIFDGLDQARWDFDETRLRKMKTYEKATTWTIMYNILTRNILPKIKIFVSSREFAVSELPAEARPKFIVTLNGLTLEDAHRLFAFLLKDKGEDIWKKIETMSPRLLSLITVPVFLILAAVVMGRDTTRPPPATVTELYNRIVSALQSVENIRNREQILAIINKLKAMAFDGMKEGSVVFKETELREFQLSPDEVQDLMTMVPGNNLLSRHLMLGDFTFFFCHQSIQEYLAASFVSEMNFDRFSRFAKKHLHESRWSIVLRFVAGIVYSKSSNDLHRVPDQIRKQQVLSLSIRSQLEEKTGLGDNYIRMELYTAIYESDDEDLMKYLLVVDASKISLSRDEVHIVGSLAARNGNLDTLGLFRCSIDDELLGIFARCLKDRIHVDEVDLRDNNLSPIALRSLLGHRRIKSLSGHMDWEVAWLPAGGWEFELRNEEDVIKISGRVFAGQFNIKESTLVFEKIHSLAYMIFCGTLFDAEFFKYDEQQHLYAKQDDLPKLSKSNLDKMNKILLDCTGEEKLEWSLIETSLEKYQFEILDIAVNGQTSVDNYNIMLEHLRKISDIGNIHSMFWVERTDDFSHIVEACQQRKIEYIRCIIDFECGSSHDAISSLVNNCNSKKVTLIYWGEDDVLRGQELMKVQQLANDLDTVLEVLLMLRSVEEGAWEQLDIEFSLSERIRRQNMYRR